MNKLILTQIGLISAGIVFIFICFFLPIAEIYDKKFGSIEIKFNLQANIKNKDGYIVMSTVVDDCSPSTHIAGYNECESWMGNYVMGILQIICGFITLIIVILREFGLKEQVSRYAQRLKIAICAISILALGCAFIGFCWLVSQQENYVLQIPAIALMLISGIVIMSGSVIMEYQIAKFKGEKLLG